MPLARQPDPIIRHLTMSWHIITVPVHCNRYFSIISSDGQGLTNPYGFTGKGTKGQGQGHHFLTLAKPQPARQVTGLLRPTGKSKICPKIGHITPSNSLQLYFIFNKSDTARIGSTGRNISGRKFGLK